MWSARVRCPGRAGALGAAGPRFTRAFEDTAVYPAKHAPKSTIAALMRVEWYTVGWMNERVVAEHAATRKGDGLGWPCPHRHRGGLP